MEKTLQEMANPTRFTFDAAAEHVYTVLLKKDCYPRFVRSEHYKNLLLHAIQPTGKKGKFECVKHVEICLQKKCNAICTSYRVVDYSFFGFGNVQARAKNNPSGKPLPCGLQAMHSHAWGSGHSTNSTRRRGSDRSLSGSTHELVTPSAKGSHSHNQSNIIDSANR